MFVLKRTLGMLFFGIALFILLVGLGVFEANPTNQSIFDSPEASGRLVGGIVFAAIVGVLGAWLWQKPKVA
jgi:hypothetical protein